MYKFADHAEGMDKAANLQTVANRLTRLSGLVPGMTKWEPMIMSDRFEHSGFDFVLYSEFSSEDALLNYVRHPDHQELVKFIGKVRTERIIVDYEVEV
jgi:hypothetical protein